MCDFIFVHGPNPWNYLPEKEVRAHLAEISSGTVQAVVAEKDGNIVGFISFSSSEHLKRYLPVDATDKPHGYICEAVVRRDCAGRGIGARLLREAVTQLQSQGRADIFVERHEENPGSAGMMRKAGFIEVDTFDDPERRASGSRRTTVCRFSSSAAAPEIERI